MLFTDTKKAKQKSVDKKIEEAMEKAKAQAQCPVAAFYDLVKITVQKVMVLNTNSDEYTVDEFE